VRFERLTRRQSMFGLERLLMLRIEARIDQAIGSLQ
jgi:hypothetical protein